MGWSPLCSCSILVLHEDRKVDDIRVVEVERGVYRGTGIYMRTTSMNNKNVCCLLPIVAAWFSHCGNRCEGRSQINVKEIAVNPKMETQSRARWGREMDEWRKGGAADM